MATLDEAAQGGEQSWDVKFIAEAVRAHEKDIPLIDWDKFTGGGIGVIRQWTEELQSALAGTAVQPSSGLLSSIWASFLAPRPKEGVFDELTVAGDRVLIQCQDQEKALHVARKAAAECGLEFLNLSMPVINQSPDQFSAMLRTILAYDKPLLVHLPTLGLLQHHKGLIQAAEAQARQLQEAARDGGAFAASPFGRHDEDQQMRQIAERAPRLAEMIAQEQRGKLLREFLGKVREGTSRIVVVLWTPGGEGIGPWTALDESLFTEGAINRSFNLPTRSLEAIGNAFIESLGRAHCAESLTRFPAKLGRVVLREGWADDAEALPFRLQLHRLARKAKRKICFEDIISISLRGTVEADELPLLRHVLESTAYHEAGHALAAIINSGGAEIPEYATAIPGTLPSGVSFLGVVAHAISNSEHEDHKKSFLDLCRTVRHALAGRAAEELIYGVENVSSGASNDLEKATQLALWHFAISGFAPGMAKAENSGQNLAIYLGLKEGLERFASPAQIDRLYGLAREFLASEYAATLELLRSHRRLLDMIVDRMIGMPCRAPNGEALRDEDGAVLREGGDPVLDKSELEEIYKAYLAG